jgi:hypothetical protein
MQRQFTALCHNTFLQDVEYNYDNILEKLNFLTLHIRRRHSDALFLINVFSGTKCCPSVLETAGIRVPAKNIRNFNTFGCSSSHGPSFRCVSAKNAVSKSTDIFKLSFKYKQSQLIAFSLFYLCCLIVVAVCIRADSVIVHWLLSSGRK